LHYGALFDEATFVKVPLKASVALSGVVFLKNGGKIQAIKLAYFFINPFSFGTNIGTGLLVK
jgi:hypothetical protein